MSNEEYKLLRDEILLCFQNISNYNTVLYTASGAILTFALGKTEYYYSLVPLVVILPLCLLCENEHKKICMIASYLQTFYEGENYQWETRLTELDNKFGNKKRPVKEILPYIVLASLCCGSSAFKVHANENTGGYYYLVPILFCYYSIDACKLL